MNHKASFRIAIGKLMASALLVALPAAEADVQAGGFLSPQVCHDHVLYTLAPLAPRHVLMPEGGCSVSVRFQVQPSGKVGYPLDDWRNRLEDLGELVVGEPHSCRNTHGAAVIQALRRAQFASSEQGFQCAYTYNWVFE